MSATTAQPAADLRRTLDELAHNLAYAWLPEIRHVFARLDPDAWRGSRGNPAAVLSAVGADELERRVLDAGLHDDVERARSALAAELDQPTWWERTKPAEGFLAAYFSAEFGVDASLPIYSGGLGVLAGDHLKSASELGVPLVGVGLFYREGYFRQALEGGGQVERYPSLIPAELPLTREIGRDGAPLTVTIEMADERVAAAVWRAQVGRIPLLLLDTEVEGNDEPARDITGRLYGGDRELRLRQELVLGVGGTRALEALGLTPSVFHMNEGHSAFLVLERLRMLRSEGRSPADVLDAVRASTVFTTHTPVPAGNEVFEPDLVQRYAGPAIEAAGLSWDEVLALGTAEGHPGFGLTPFALRTSRLSNAVSALHETVSKRMWASIWPDRDLVDVPIGHVTNGVHPRTWLAPEVEALLRTAGVRPEADLDEARWDAAQQVDPAELWRAHVGLRRRLLDEVGTRLGAGAALDPDALTVGFARRFATYKRGGLLLSDPERLGRLLADPDRPLQILVAGKAHPADDGGKEVIRRIASFVGDARSHGRLVFLEDYDMALARLLIHGADVWLNNPRRPYEASGTSGMKAALNGGLNLSVLDGWWCEGYTPDVGWAFGAEAEGSTDEEQDERDAADLFRLLEQEVLPTFFDRDADGVPRRWAGMMRASIARLGGRFSTSRMVREYVEHYYLPAHRGA